MCVCVCVCVCVCMCVFPAIFCHSNGHFYHLNRCALPCEQVCLPSLRSVIRSRQKIREGGRERMLTSTVARAQRHGDTSAQSCQELLPQILRFSTFDLLLFPAPFQGNLHSSIFYLLAFPTFPQFSFQGILRSYAPPLLILYRLLFLVSFALLNLSCRWNRRTK